MLMVKKKQWKMKTPVGPLYLVATEKGLSGAFWSEKDIAYADHLRGNDPITHHLMHAERELKEYFSGKRKDFNVVLDLEGTDFQKKVWQQLRKIPYAKTISYQELAKRIKNEKACRAVGSANGKNPVSIIVPCHRVITSQGTIGGYNGGLEAKRCLLEVESGVDLFNSTKGSS